ncbi:MAG: porin family protein [Elusimicrobiaceae bacterium]|nr:porin family protein [Elusimicrobiaceae bacterium]
MKKLLLAVFAVFALSAASFASGWGLGVKLGAGQNDPKGMQENHDAFGGTFTKSPGVFALEGQYEWDLGGQSLETTGSVNKLGLRFGFDFYGENKLEAPGGTEKENTVSLPITVYYKHDGGIKNASWYAGAGFTSISTEVEVPGDTIKEDKIFPHIMAGAEYRFTKLFALGLDLKYNFNAKIMKYGGVLADRSGVQGVLAARFYF